MIKMPMAIRPCSEVISPFSSSALTTKTVLEKLKAKAIRHRALKVQPGDERRSRQRQRIDRKPEDHDDDGCVQAGDRPHLRPCERRKVELQPDNEEQQGDAEIGKFLKHLSAGDSEGV